MVWHSIERLEGRKQQGQIEQRSKALRCTEVEVAQGLLLRLARAWSRLMAAAVSLPAGKGLHPPGCVRDLASREVGGEARHGGRRGATVRGGRQAAAASAGIRGGVFLFFWSRGGQGSEEEDAVEAWRGRKGGMGLEASDENIWTPGSWPSILSLVGSGPSNFSLLSAHGRRISLSCRLSLCLPRSSSSVLSR